MTAASLTWQPLPTPRYEVGDPGAYHVPDVACDMTGVTIAQVGEHEVREP
jgi:hypothetical protein